jgi:hypothetical protein
MHESHLKWIISKKIQFNCHEWNMLYPSTHLPTNMMKQLTAITPENKNTFLHSKLEHNFKCDIYNWLSKTWLRLKRENFQWRIIKPHCHLWKQEHSRNKDINCEYSICFIQSLYATSWQISKPSSECLWFILITSNMYKFARKVMLLFSTFSHVNSRLHCRG